MNEISTKDRIRQVSHELLMQYGIRSVSMDDIAAKLGISKKTIYQFFKDKDELVEAVIGSMIITNQDTCIADRQQADNAIHEIFIAMDMVTEIFRSINPSVLFDLQKYHPATYSKFLDHKNEFLLSMMRQNISRGIREELYRPEINIEVMARYRVESLFMPFNPAFIKDTKASLLEIEQELIIHFLYGLVSLKGYKIILKYQGQKKKAAHTSIRSLKV